MASRRALRLLGVAIALAPFALLALLLLLSRGTTSLAVVAPNAIWLLLAYFGAPILIGVLIWRFTK